MGIEAGDLIVGSLMIALRLIGLFLAAVVHDNQMYVFGLSLAGWGAVFVFSLVRRRFDQRDIARVAVRGDEPRG